MSHSVMSAMLEALPYPALFIDRYERILAANTTAETLFGQGFVARHYITVLRQPALLDCVEKVLTERQASTAQMLTSQAGRDVTLIVHAAPVAADDIDGVLVTFDDVSQKQSAAQMRRDFVANVSHELRTPLTALLGFIETLRGPARDDAKARARFLGIMSREAERMNRLVRDLLSLSRVEEEERVRPTARVDLSQLLTVIQHTLTPQAEDAGATLVLDGCAEMVTVPGDEDQLMQVFTNLFENAIKYGGGEIRVSVSRHAHDAALRAPAIRVAVADQGPGVDALHLPRLTERFYRVDAHRSREIGGTGLGLAIVKHIVNRHRGRLRIESEPGQGSRFIVVLPNG